MKLKLFESTKEPVITRIRSVENQSMSLGKVQKTKATCGTSLVVPGDTCGDTGVKQACVHIF